MIATTTSSSANVKPLFSLIFFNIVFSLPAVPPQTESFLY
jgi:hypothetical protein